MQRIPIPMFMRPYFLVVVALPCALLGLTYPAQAAEERREMAGQEQPICLDLRQDAQETRKNLADDAHCVDAQIVLQKYLFQDGESLQNWQTEMDALELSFDAEHWETSLQKINQWLDKKNHEPAFSAEKRQALVNFRVRMATKLLALAGGDEKGQATTTLGQKAQQLLIDAIRDEPALTLSADRYSPKMRTLFSGASAKVAADPRQVVEVTEAARGSIVWINGRRFDVAPVRLELPLGTYKLWLESPQGIRSAVRVIDLQNPVEKITVDIDMQTLSTVLSILSTKNREVQQEILENIKIDSENAATASGEWLSKLEKLYPAWRITLDTTCLPIHQQAIDKNEQIKYQIYDVVEKKAAQNLWTTQKSTSLQQTAQREESVLQECQARQNKLVEKADNQKGQAGSGSEVDPNADAFALGTGIAIAVATVAILGAGATAFWFLTTAQAPLSVEIVP